MNKWLGMGRLTRDPEMRTSSGGTVFSRFNLAVDRKYKKEGMPDADFIPILAIGKTAEFAEKYLNKGIKIVIEGQIQTSTYQKEDGSTGYSWEVLADSIEFAESKRESDVNRTARDDAAVDGFISVPDGIIEELPFS